MKTSPPYSIFMRQREERRATDMGRRWRRTRCIRRSASTMPRYDITIIRDAARAISNASPIEDGRDISTMFKPFKLSVDDAVLLDLKERLSKTRWPDQLRSPSNDGWLYGTELTYIKKLALYWENEFDWRKNEAKFNAIGPQFLILQRNLVCIGGIFRWRRFIFSN